MRDTQDMHGFKIATGDVNYLDYGAIWYRHAGTREYHFVALINWEDAIGEREAREIGARYNMQLSIVDLDAIPESELAGALQYTGQQSETDDRWLALSCHEHGNKAPIQDVDTNNFHKTFAQLARESRAISKNASVRRNAMRRPVNKLGSTASEYMRGDLTSALVRGVVAGKTEALILAKMHVACAKSDKEKEQ